MGNRWNLQHWLGFALMIIGLLLACNFVIAGAIMDYTIHLDHFKLLPHARWIWVGSMVVAVLLGYLGDKIFGSGDSERPPIKRYW